MRASTLTKPRIARFPDTEILLSICSGIEKVSKNQKISAFCAGLVPRDEKGVKNSDSGCSLRRESGRWSDERRDTLKQPRATAD